MLYILNAIFTHAIGQTTDCMHCGPRLKNILSHREPSIQKKLTVYLQTSQTDILIEKLRLHGILAQSSYELSGILSLQVTQDELRQYILSDPHVTYIDLGNDQPHEEILIPQHNLNYAGIHALHQKRPELDGAGETISIKENLPDTADIDLYHRFTISPQSSDVQSQHATIMATWAAGAGNAGPEGRGIARGARVVPSDFGGILPDPPAFYNQYGISLQNHSYGSEIDNQYSLQALAFDQSMIENKELQHIFSSGNDGMGAASSGTYQDLLSYANLSGSFKMAKNALVVGAVNSQDQVLSFSSRGPASDGRIKPDLVAYGPDGSSGAAAIISGASALIRQAYYNKYHQRMTSDILRSLLICSASDIGVPGPSFETGYGRLDLPAAIDVIDSGVIISDSIHQDQIREYRLNVTTERKRLSVALCWNDPPSSPGTSKALVNDLDLELITPQQEIILPWILNTFPVRDSLSKPATKNKDTLNNTEWVSMDLPIQGNYILRIKASHLRMSQRYSVVIYQEPAETFAWQNPVYGDVAEADRNTEIRWSSNLSQDSAILEWKPAGDRIWRKISEIEVSSQNFSWMVPDTFCTAQLRLRTPQSYYVSDSFLIARSSKLKAGFVCKDSILFFWPSASETCIYTIWGLDQYFMTPLLQTVDTFVILKKNDYPQSRFAVSFNDKLYQLHGPPGYAPDPSQLGNSCYFVSFLGKKTDGMASADLRLEIGTTYGIQKIVIEKLIDQHWKVLFAEDNPQNVVQFRDSFLNNGSNIYRAGLVLQDSQNLNSEKITIWNPGKTGILVFPNPVKSNDQLTILSEDALFTEPLLTIYDLTGKLILQMLLTDVRTLLPLGQLKAGTYIWQIKKTNTSPRSGLITVLP